MFASASSGRPPAQPARDQIDPGVSSYIDLVRVTAALTVFVSHYSPPLFGVGDQVIPGHDAVIVFFVLSGYVIAYVTEQRDQALAGFAIHRLARLWSVLLPSLLLSVLAAMFVGETINGVAPATSSAGAFITATFRNLFFLGETWGLSADAPYNLPVWSLNYEAWYYAIYAAYVFAPQRARWAAVGGVAFIAGPHVVTLMPIWLLGVWLYRSRDRFTLSVTMAYLLFFATIAIYVVAYILHLTSESRGWLRVLTAAEAYRLGPSTSLIGDILIAPLVAGNILAIAHMPAVNRLLIQIRRFTKVAASRTLSIYLYHMPIFTIAVGVFGLGKDGAWSALLCTMLGLVVCIILGNFTEARLESWRGALARAFAIASHVANRAEAREAGTSAAAHAPRATRGAPDEVVAPIT